MLPRRNPRRNNRLLAGGDSHAVRGYFAGVLAPARVRITLGSAAAAGVADLGVFGGRPGPRLIAAATGVTTLSTTSFSAFFAADTTASCAGDAVSAARPGLCGGEQDGTAPAERRLRTCACFAVLPGVLIPVGLARSSGDQR